MAEYLYQQEPASYADGAVVNLHFRQQDALLTAMPACDEMEEHWGINTIDLRHNSAVKIHFRTGLEDGALEQALIDKGATKAGETFDLVRFMGPGVAVKGLAWSVDCAAANCIEFEIEVVKRNCDTGTDEVLQSIKGLKGYEGVWAKQDWLAKPVGIEGGFVGLVRLKFTKLPYKDAAGNQFWGDGCNPVPCMGIQIHALTEDTCMRRELRGCGTSCCSAMPSTPCEQKTLTKNCG